jgi:hypothetical protein
MECQSLATAANIIPLEIKPRVAKPELPARFKIQSFTNPRTGNQSWRVTGMKRDRKRVRENFADQKAAQCRQVALATEFLTGQRETTVQATKRTETQIRLAEAAFIRLENEQDLPHAVEYWLKHGKQRKSPRNSRLHSFKTLNVVIIRSKKAPTVPQCYGWQYGSRLLEPRLPERKLVLF